MIVFVILSLFFLMNRIFISHDMTNLYPIQSSGGGGGGGLWGTSANIRKTLNPYLVNWQLSRMTGCEPGNSQLSEALSSPYAVHLIPLDIIAPLS